jgi:hypothetical protein
VTFKPVLPRVRYSRFDIFSDFAKEDPALKNREVPIPIRTEDMVLINLLRSISFENILASVTQNFLRFIITSFVPIFNDTKSGPVSS